MICPNLVVVLNLVIVLMSVTMESGRRQGEVSKNCGRGQRSGYISGVGKRPINVGVHNECDYEKWAWSKGCAQKLWSLMRR